MGDAFAENLYSEILHLFFLSNTGASLINPYGAIISLVFRLLLLGNFTPWKPLLCLSLIGAIAESILLKFAYNLSTPSDINLQLLFLVFCLYIVVPIYYAKADTILRKILLLLSFIINSCTIGIIGFFI